MLGFESRSRSTGFAVRGGRWGRRRRGRRTLAALAAAAGLTAVVAAVARPVLVLEIRAPGRDLVYVSREVRPGDTLTYRFVHSVSRTPVKEVWTVVADPAEPGLRLRSITYQATGAGLPSGPDSPGATFEVSEEGFTIRGLDRPIRLPLDLRVTPAAGNSLELSGATIDLTGFPAPGGDGHASLVRLTLRRMGWLAAFVHARP